mmetsp:Transcript_49971/g.119256  ORF Transcript_49971/g.119256 Transcript_49971/m.119256 type:complete len:347 (-) Transcript_49971:104-1144(-)|eukprot:CAMPEP_0181458672 /NCGR_PEP_ID=MMETSP1110-20121109/32430_1 /TAXON_ID=174948 /ORGANISM="Symbiodinium sp., Strain CCMP421" /LENGTH=346 /DNA_ID=CAMNT_0023583167 /DNA_START=73 /DNA_END=1113 /DNA_ORIENTATION=+
MTGHAESEEDPLLKKGQSPFTRKIGDTVICCCLPPAMIAASATLIRTNQYLMQPDVFPYPFIMVIMHCIFCSLFGLLLLALKPALFPALTDPDRKVELSASFYTRAILPIAICFAVSLVLSNMAYKYCTLAFLQMLKESNIVNIYVMSLLAGIEKFSTGPAVILVTMLLATWSCVEGELNFSLAGFLTQGTASLCEAAKTIFQCLVLSGPRRLDPLSTVLVVMPMCGFLLMTVVVFNNVVMPLSFVTQPHLSEIVAMRWYLALNISNAFVLNVLIAMFLSYLSPVAYILTGNVKDIVIVLMSSWLMHETVSHMQVFGFTVQICCVCAWSIAKQQKQKSAEQSEETN